MFQLVVFCVLANVVIGANSPSGLHEISGRIVGGHDVTIEEIPYQVSLIHYGAHHCGGSILTRNAILTAAHCIALANVNKLEVRVGSTYRTHGGIIVPVSSATPHPEFNEQNADNDVGIVKLTQFLEFDSTIQPIAMIPKGTKFDVGVVGLVSGWGLLKENGQQSEVLQAVTAPIHDHEKCKQLYADMDLTDTMLCAGYLEGGRGTCNTDSGGPLVARGFLIGVVSWGIGCASEGHLGVFADVRMLQPWIYETIHKEIRLASFNEYMKTVV